MPKVIIMVNCSMAPAPFALASWIKSQEYACRKGIPTDIRITQQTANPYLAANSITQDVLKDSSVTHLMFGCDDAISPEDIVTKLVDRDKDIITGVFRMRDATKRRIAIKGNDGECFDDFIKKEVLIEREFCSGHSMTINSKVLKAVWDAHPELEFEAEDGSRLRGVFLPYINNGKLFQDDFAFSKRATDLGFHCWVDFGVKLIHKCETWLAV